jgi:arylsulfatase A-like enzyme
MSSQQAEPRDLTYDASPVSMRLPPYADASRAGTLPVKRPITGFDEGGSLSQDFVVHRPKWLSFLILLAWCGLVSGLLEVGAIVLRKQLLDFNRLYWMTRHFVWIIPLINLFVFLFLGLTLLVVVWSRWPRDRWLAVRALCVLTVLPPIWAVSNRIIGPAGFVIALGVAARLVPPLERRAAGFQRLVRFSFPFVACAVPLIAATFWGLDELKVWREAARPLPQSGSPNVLLIVLDTVGANHLSLHGYNRPTSPTLDELGDRGIRFERMVATSSWSLPSHANMFTGRWPHELSPGFFTPLDRSYPTLAEFLGARGYATAGFIANYSYCASDSGLDRGFTTYQDYVFERLSFLSMAALFDRPLSGLEAIYEVLRNRVNFGLLGSVVKLLTWQLKTNRKDAAVLNREFLDWLSSRSQPERPFFAFLNYFDAHFPYEVPATGIHRFGVRPRSNREYMVIHNWMGLIKTGPSPRQIGFALDAYDDCVAELDEQLGRLIDELDRRAVLERTWLIITSDHGESFGEKPGVFWHGTSLYQTQLHVPMVIIPPAGGPSPRVVTETASLRDLPATIVDVLGFSTGSPFPGSSFARFWDGSVMGSPNAAASEQVLSELVPMGLFGPNPFRWSYTPRWPIAALTLGDLSYIRRDGDVAEELYRVREDARALYDLASDRSMLPTLERMRSTLGRLTAGPLTPERFNP